MAKHNPNQPTTGESYNGLDNQFQQGAFKKPEEREENDHGDEDEQDLEDNPGDAYTNQLANGGLYDSEEEEDEEEND